MRKEQGFTVVELLIVVGIMAVIVGVVAMNMGGEERVSALAEDPVVELSLVTTAIDAYNQEDLARGESPIPPRADAAPIGTADEDAPFAKYLPTGTTHAYSWDADGADLEQK